MDRNFNPDNRHQDRGGFRNRNNNRRGNWRQNNNQPFGTNRNQNHWRRNEENSGDRRGNNNNEPPNRSHHQSRNEGNSSNRRSSDDDRPRNNNNQNNRRPRRMGFKFVQELLEEDNLENLLFTLSDEKKCLKEILEDHTLTPDFVVLIVKLMSKVCDCPFKSTKISLLNSTVESKFTQTVTNFVATIAVQNNRDKRFNNYFWKDTDEFWHNLIKLSKHLNDTIPSSSCEVTMKLLKALTLCIPQIEEMHSIHVSDTIKSEIKHLYDIVEETSKKIEKKKEAKSYLPDYDDDMEPPDDFRDIPVYPSAKEITTQYKPFLRVNVVKGPYQSVSHYLDVQYRLLREDFVAPLRNGICKYTQDPRNKWEDVKIYEVIRFLNMETVTDQNCYRIQYDFSKKKKNFQFENSKRFMYGSLLCFTADKFKSVIFAKVQQRDIKDLEKGHLIVGFNPEVVLPENLYDLDFLMVESKVYFEPYYQVLNVLKHIPSENFPMERYIIDVETSTEPPEYLLQIDPVYLTIENKKFWPLALRDEDKFYNLNDAQNEAFKAALTKEFVIIQGPPGTGKTFLGLKIARTLLDNYEAWYNKTPMLVICFTNHALDQFLEGLLETTKELIRVGGQSKNEKLNDYNIRRKKHGNNSNPAIYQKRAEVRESMQEIADINATLNEIEKCSSVLDFSVFSDIVPDYKSSWFYTTSDDKIIAWLLVSGQNRMNFRENMPEQQRNLRSAQAEDADYEPLDREQEENLDQEVNEIENDEIFEDLVITKYRVLTSEKILSNEIVVLNQKLVNLNTEDEMSPWERENEQYAIQIELFKLENELDTLRFRLEMGENMKNNAAPPDTVDMANPHNMTPDARWQLYFYWVSLYEQKLREKKEILSKTFRQVYSVYNEMRDMEDAEIMKDSLVVGMTTTGAARLQASLQALKSPIVIVEEAAEVLEAHIVSALTPFCQHLILIGDHQQLKPSTANFKIETKYLLGVSLFERMVANSIQCHTLNIQHRMRPNIADLVRPAIYSVLNDHASVLDRPDIAGVESNLFFLDHQEKEEMCSDNSKKNVHEARFLIQFARHLILNEYKPEQIVILAAYLGQLFEMQRERRQHKHLLQDVRIAVLDNYQGEESDIVLLSLVRSNKEGKIGFLKIENRVCVALSRARNGFYIMGNMQQLCDNSEIWPQIRETLNRQNAIGPHLTLRCQIHREQINNVSKASDFFKFPEGGCDLQCERPLNCGHVCTRLCHVEDREHLLYKCQHDCEKLLCEDPRHVCRKFCYQECGPCSYPVERHLKCGHVVKIECHLDPDKHNCTVTVQTTLPCGHEAMKPCSTDPMTFKCPSPCDTRVEPCGHACAKSCHARVDPDHLQYRCMKHCQLSCKGCTNTEEPHICPNLCYQECPPCAIPVMKARTKCAHFYNIACSANPDDILCEKPCKKKLPCGHICKKKCHEPCGDCQFEVEKEVSDCKHKIKIKCSVPPDREYCKGICPRPLACGHLCGKKCNDYCRTRCKEVVDCFIPSPCGHTMTKIQCYIKNNVSTSDYNKTLLDNCTEPCDATLKCGHRCSGTCGTCLQGRFHQHCTEKCGVILVCNHECSIPCREACKPCTRPCEYSCKHSRCRKTCGDPCTSCKEKCSRACEHQKCKRRCGQYCSVPPCEKPCPKKIKKCKHDCVGFCGDPCPRLCRICDKDELTEIFFGTEDEPDARFVHLKDCGHVMESTGMEAWLKNDEDEQNRTTISPKVCPKCKTVIKKTQRYSDYVKQNMEDLMKVKIQFFGTENEIKELKETLRDDLSALLTTTTRFIYTQSARELINKLLANLEDTKGNRRQYINKMGLDAIRIRVDLLKMILKDEYLNSSQCPLSNKQVNFIISLMVKNMVSISPQETDDIVLEIDRLHTLNQYEKVTKHSIGELPLALSTIGSDIQQLTRYTNAKDADIKTQLKKLSSSIITERERKEIVAALGLTQGHWFKCPNGHVYAIADCGGAVITSRCNECGAEIGGSDHRLLETNRLATEMDGATYAAWSEQANMFNYQFIE